MKLYLINNLLCFTHYMLLTKIFMSYYKHDDEKLSPFIKYILSSYIFILDKVLKSNNI